VAKGAMPLLCWSSATVSPPYERMRARGVEFAQEPVARYGSVDAGFRDRRGTGGS
jgi:hypothetical protein